MPAEPSHVEEWSGEDVTVTQIEKALCRLRDEAAAETAGPDLRTSVMTHLAWVPPEWHEAATGTLAGLAERHPSRAILLVPERDGGEGLAARVQVLAFDLPGERRHIAAEVIELRLRGERAKATSSIVMPLLITGLPVFCRWRGRPWFGSPELAAMVELADRLVVDSREWPDVPQAYEDLAVLFDDIAVSDIAWRRTRPWRLRLASGWPDVAELSRLRVEGPAPEAHLLAGWLRSRLRRGVELEHVDADEVEAVTVDGEPCEPPREERLTPSDLLSEELDSFARDRVYEDAVRAAI